MFFKDLHVTVTFIDLIPGIDPTLRVSDSNHLIIKELPLKKKTRFMFTSETGLLRNLDSFNFKKLF